MKRIVFSIVCGFFPLLAVGFVNFDLNISEWGETERLVVALFSPLIAIFAYSCPAWAK